MLFLFPPLIHKIEFKNFEPRQSDAHIFPWEKGIKEKL